MPTMFKHEQPTRAQAKAQRDRLWRKLDRAENAKVKARSGGLCEVCFVRDDGQAWIGFTRRCPNRASEIHHGLGGWRLRGRGISALAEHKIHCCHSCHEAITGTVGRKLVRVGGPVPHWTDAYREA